MSEHARNYCDKEVEEIAVKAAQKATSDVLTALGIDASEPHELQQDMMHLRKQRQASEKITLAVKLSLIGTICTGILSLVGLGLVQAIQSLKG